jgi:undecaprenyl-diphosphatase
LAFIIVSIFVLFEITIVFDQTSVEYFQSIAGNPGLDLLMQAITEAGDVYYMLIFSVILLIIKKTRRIGLALMILLVLATLLTGYIKCGVDRDRPDLEFTGVQFPIELSSDTFALFCEGGVNASYPSGHVARATIFGIILSFALSGRFPHGCYLLLIYPLLMSISRVYVLQHFPMDVIGGTILGVLLAGVIAKKTKLNKKKSDQ